MSFPQNRMRRLRQNGVLREMVRETHLDRRDLIMPLFVEEGIGASAPIVSMPGQSRHSLEGLVGECRRLADAGVMAVILFGIPAEKDEQGSGAWDDRGIVQQAMRRLKVPVSEVLASPYCRTMDTARQLGLGDVQASNAVMNLRVAEYFGGREAIVATARALLARPPSAGSNRVIVAHGNVAQAATPVYPGEGEAVIFAPDGQGRFRFIGRIPPERWVELSPGD